MTNPNDPNLLSELLLDSLRGELSPDEACRLEARLAQDGDLRRERDRLAAFLGAAGSAHALALDPKAGERTAARVLDRVRREEARSARAAATPAARRRPIFWARLLAVSVAVHVVVLGVLGTRRETPPAPTGGPADVPFSSIAAAPDAADEGFPLPTDPDDPAMAVAGPYAFDHDEPLPIEELLTPTDLLPGATRERYASFVRGSARAMFVRTSDPMKRLIETRVGTPGTLERVQRGLEALAARQGADGSFAPKAPLGGGAGSTGDVRTTATVLLAFLGDGSSSRSGTHRDAVARGIAWLRSHAPTTTDLADRSLACLALAEDFMLASGSLTPAESRGRSTELASLRTDIATATRVASPKPDVPATPRADAAERWAELALGAISRAGVGPAVPATLRVHPSGDLPLAPAVDPQTAMLEGADVLRGGRGDAFVTWNRATAKTLGARLSGDGLVVRDGTANLEETALILLSLQVAYRTY